MGWGVALGTWQRRVAVCIAGTAATFALARPALLTHVIDPNAAVATVDVYAAVLWQGSRSIQQKAMAEFGTLPGMVRLPRRSPHGRCCTTQEGA